MRSVRHHSAQAAQGAVRYLFQEGCQTIIHCSHLPRIWQCGASALPRRGSDDIQDVPGPDAALGIAVHEAMAAYVQNAPFDAAVLAAKHGVDADDMMPLIAAGRDIWVRYRDTVSVVAIETRMTHSLDDRWHLTGQPDLVGTAYGRTCAVVLDWKTGNVERDARHQIMGGLWLAFHDIQEAQRGLGITIYLRSRQADVFAWTTEQAAAWASRLTDICHQGRWAPSPEPCQYCPQRTVCPRYAQMIRGTAALVKRTAAGHLTPAQVVALWPRAEAMRRAIEEYREMVRTLIASSGPIPIDADRELALMPTERRTVDPSAAWPVLRDYGAEHDPLVDFGDAISISLDGIRRSEAARWARGHKSQAIERLMGLLNDAGAIRTETGERLTVRRQAGLREEGSNGETIDGGRR
jgi:hypothetical protein